MGIYDAKKQTYRLKRGVHRMVGISDIIAVIGGRAVFIELKSASGRLSENQLSFLARAKDAGAVAVMVRSVEELQLELLRYFPELI